MILIDSNSLIVLLIGLIDPELINTHKKTSIYEKEDFYNLVGIIKDFKNVLVLPNIWTEVDNHLNRFSGERKFLYVQQLTKLLKSTSEKYIESQSATELDYFINLGITDSLILRLAEECQFLITSDSQLSDYARAYGIKVYDMKKIKNEKFK